MELTDQFFLDVLYPPHTLPQTVVIGPARSRSNFVQNNDSKSTLFLYSFILYILHHSHMMTKITQTILQNIYTSDLLPG